MRLKRTEKEALARQGDVIGIAAFAGYQALIFDTANSLSCSESPHCSYS